MDKLFSIFQELIDFLFPKVSIVSGKMINDGNSNQYLNDDEIFVLNRVTESDLNELKTKTISDESFSLYAFREGDDFSKIIYNLKYAGMKNLGICFGRILGEKMLDIYNLHKCSEYDLLIPVPLFKAKQRERGYNQCEYLCRGMNEKFNLELITDLISRNRNTSTQTKLNRSQRMSNVKNAFSLNMKYPDFLKGKKVILADDVITTGSTINEVIRILKNSGAEKVFACTLAMARD